MQLLRCVEVNNRCPTENVSAKPMTLRLAVWSPPRNSALLSHRSLLAATDLKTPLSSFKHLSTMGTSYALKLLPVLHNRRLSHHRFLWGIAPRTGGATDIAQLSLSRRQPTDFLTRHHFSSNNVSPSTSSNLGLAETLVRPHYESIRQLPEIVNALHNWDDISALADLQRATQIFEMMQAGGSLHIAAIAVLAECCQHQGNYEKASNALNTLKTLVPESSDTLFRIDLARAKALWYRGDLQNSMICVQQSMETDTVDDSSLNKGCVLNAEGIVRLLNSPCRAEDASSVIYSLKIASKLTERDSRNSARSALASASAKGNLGIAMVITRLGLQEVCLACPCLFHPGQVLFVC